MTTAEGEDTEPTPDENAPATYPASDDPALPADADGGATRALSALLKLSPFLDLYRKAGGQRRMRFALCFTMDLVLRLVVAAVLVGIIAGTAWKVLAPLPPLFQDLP